MKNYLTLCLVCLAILFSGCPFSSEVAIDAGEAKIDEKILGKWEPKNSSDYHYIVTKYDDATYQIVKKPKNETDAPTTYYGFFSNVGGTRFLNVWDGTNEGARTYYFYKAEITPSGSKLTLSPVTDNIKETFTTSNDLKTFFEKHKSLSFFYSKDDEEYIRAD